MEPPDTTLIERAQRGDADAFAALVRAHERVALSVAYGVLGDSGAAGDVAQEGFIRAWERLGELREPPRFASWLCGIVRNLAIDQLRRRRPSLPLSSTQRPLEPDRWTADPLRDADRHERQRRLADAVASLDETSRLVVGLRYYQSLSSKEIAELLDMTPAAVDMRLSRARKQLKTLLETEVEPTPVAE